MWRPFKRRRKMKVTLDADERVVQAERARREADRIAQRSAPIAARSRELVAENRIAGIVIDSLRIRSAPREENRLCLKSFADATGSS